MDRDYSPKYSEDFLSLLDGIDEECHFQPIHDDPPEWLDEEKFCHGLKFFHTNIFGILLCSFRNLMVGLCLPNLSIPLLMTRRTHTLAGALRRYAETAYYTTKFYSLLPWDNKRLFNKINSMHSSAARKVRDKTAEERKQLTADIVSEMPASIREITAMDKVMLDNLNYLKETQFSELNYDAYERYVSSETAYSQLDMVMTSMAFFGSYVMFPGVYGGQNCSEKGLLSFVHVWRTFGHYLGIDDRLNLARFDNDLGRLQRLLRELTVNLVVPGLLDHGENYIYLSKVTAKAFNVDYHLMMYEHCLAHGIELKNLWKEFSLWQKSWYFIRRFVTDVLMPFAAVNALLNFFSRSGVNSAYSLLKGRSKKASCPVEKLLIEATSEKDAWYF